MPDTFDVSAVVVHDEQLQRESVEGVSRIGRLEGVAVADEDELAAGRRTRSQVVYAPGGQRRLRPVGRSGVRRERLPRERDDLPRRHVDLVQVRALMVFDVVELRVINPLTVEGDGRIGYRFVPRDRDQHFLLAIGVQQHEVGARFHAPRIANLGPLRPAVALPAGRRERRRCHSRISRSCPWRCAAGPCAAARHTSLAGTGQRPRPQGWSAARWGEAISSRHLLFRGRTAN